VAISLTPEQALLQAALLPPGSAAQRLPVAGEFRVDQLFELAEWHRLAPLLWHRLCAGPTDFTVPAGIADQLREAARTTTARNLYLLAQLDLVLAALEREEISAMVLKGVALVEDVYPSIGLRPMDDVDLLVPREWIQRALEVVEALGYEVRGDELGRDDSERLVTSHHHYPLANKRTGAVIELHHHVTLAWPKFAIRGFWDRAVPGKGDVPHLRPSAEDLLLHVALHFTVDRVERRQCALGQVADVAWIVGQGSIDWAALVQRAGEYGVSDRLFLALFATSYFVADVIPSDVLEELQPSSFTDARGEEFIRLRVLRSRPAAPLERLTEVRRLLFPNLAGLVPYIHEDEEVAPSRLRLYLRRAVGLGRRLMHSVASPRSLLEDLRLSRWIRSLRA
jgi:hypothetical protein